MKGRWPGRGALALAAVVAGCAGPVAETVAPPPSLLAAGQGARRPLLVRVSAGRLHVQVLSPAGALPMPPWVRLVGDGGASSAPTEADGVATFVLAELEPAAFPFRATFATVGCDGCADGQVRLAPGDAAALVLARSRLDDLDAFLAVHPAAIEVKAVRAARRAEAERQRQEQVAAADAAAAALEVGDFAGAAAALQRCRSAEIEVLPRCRRLDGQIVQDFARLQQRLVDDAVAVRRFDDADAAVYRCTIVARDHPACATARDLVTAARVDLWLERAVDASQREGFAKAFEALQACLDLVPDHPPCLAQAAQVAKAEVAWRGRELKRLAAAAGNALKRRRFAASQELAAQCLALDPGHRRCLKVQTRLARRRPAAMPTPPHRTPAPSPLPARPPEPPELAPDPPEVPPPPPTYGDPDHAVEAEAPLDDRGACWHTAPT